MTLIELKSAKELFTREVTRLNAINVNCNSCEHYHNQRCHKWDSTPPETVKAAGCPDWEYCWVPF